MNLGSPSSLMSDQQRVESTACWVLRRATSASHIQLNPPNPQTKSEVNSYPLMLLFLTIILTPDGDFSLCYRWNNRTLLHSAPELLKVAHWGTITQRLGAVNYCSCRLSPRHWDCKLTLLSARQCIHNNELQCSLRRDWSEDIKTNMSKIKKDPPLASKNCKDCSAKIDSLDSTSTRRWVFLKCEELMWLVMSWISWETVISSSGW